MENENNVYGQCVHGNNMADCNECRETILSGFAFQVKCECQQRGCRYCDPHNEIPLPNFDLPEPDWEEMKREFDLRLESRYFYCIEKENSAGLYLHKNGTLGRSLIGAVRFFGNDGHRMAKVYLAINHSMGYLKNFIVTEHEFV